MTVHRNKLLFNKTNRAEGMAETCRVSWQT